jgi:hypothetical protein
MESTAKRPPPKLRGNAPRVLDRACRWAESQNNYPELLPDIVLLSDRSIALPAPRLFFQSAVKWRKLGVSQASTGW